jgi:hypothetical protein
VQRRGGRELAVELDRGKTRRLARGVDLGQDARGLGIAVLALSGAPREQPPGERAPGLVREQPLLPGGVEGGSGSPNPASLFTVGVSDPVRMLRV